MLFLFGIMLTRAPLGPLRRPGQRTSGSIAILGRRSLLLGVLACALIDTLRGTDEAHRSWRRRRRTTPKQISDSIFATYLIPFEVVSVLLLAALIGAIVLARRTEGCRCC